MSAEGKKIARDLERQAAIKRSARAIALTRDEFEKAVAVREGYFAELGRLGGWPQDPGKGPVKDSQANVLMAINVLGLNCTFDKFRSTYLVSGFELGGGLVGDLGDKMIRAFRDYCFQMLEYEPGIQATREGLKRACEAHAFNSVVDYLDGLQWDGVKRLDTWLSRYLGVKDTPLHRQWGRLTLMAGCRRPFEPGCKYDHILSLEGPEGGGKSTMVKVLAGAKTASELCPYFSDSTILDKNEKEQLELSQGIWWYELAEMSGASKADQKKLKAFATRQEDRAREAYAYFKTAQPRSPIFIATINPDPNTGEIPEYLNPGDRRRWWPVAVGTIDIEGLIRDRDQLFAEAMVNARTFDGEWHPLTLDSKFWKLAEAEQVAREIKHPYRDILAPLYGDILRMAGQSEGPDDEAWSRTGSNDKANGWRVTDAYVMVAAWYILKNVLPPNASTEAGGRAVSGSMGALGWMPVRQREGMWYRKPRPGMTAINGVVTGAE